MSEQKSMQWLLGVCILIGLLALAFALPQSVQLFKEYDRTVAVKGLSEREVPADVVNWPITFTAASNDVQQVYHTQEINADKIKAFLIVNGIDANDISISSPAVVDKSAQQYGGEASPYRYVSTQTITVYSPHVDLVRQVMPKLVELGKEGIVFAGDDYQKEYIFTGLNALKPKMIEEATRQAREVAEKFAKDSNSRLGKIRKASQGQFSIDDRDRNNPHIKKIRVVSTIEYYLAD